MLERAIDTVDAVWDALQSGVGGASVSASSGNIGRAIMEGPAMLELLDNPTTFPLLWDILGWNVQLYLSSISVKPPEVRPDGPVSHPSLLRGVSALRCPATAADRWMDVTG